MQIRHCVDVLTANGACGWAYAPVPGAAVVVQVWSGDQCIAETIPDLHRIDVASASGLDHDSRLGFGIEFKLPEDAAFADLSVRLLLKKRKGDVVEAITAAQLQLLTETGRRAIRSAPGVGHIRSAFPQEVAGLVAALWPDAPVGSRDEDDQRAIADKILLLAAQPATEELRPVLAYVRYLRDVWAHCDFVRRYFPRVNKDRSPADKDYSCVPNSPQELMVIAHHLYVLKSHGAAGAFAEFGCYKGYSTSMLSYACERLGIPMHVFDSFEGLPLTNSPSYRAGEFAGSLAEVEGHVRAYGTCDALTFHKGFFSETVPAMVPEKLIAIWMDVDLEASAADVMRALPRLDSLGAVFSHETTARNFKGDSIVAEREANAVIPPILDGFNALGRSPIGRFLCGSTGVFWADGGLPVLAAAPLQALLAAV